MQEKKQKQKDLQVLPVKPQEQLGHLSSLVHSEQEVIFVWIVIYTEHVNLETHTKNTYIGEKKNIFKLSFPVPCVSADST